MFTFSNPLPARIQRAVQTLVIHCSATPSGKPISNKPAVTAAKVINGWHRDRKPPFMRQPAAVARFNAQLGSIGYHYVIGLDGHVLTGRHPDEVGAHVAGHNATSLGVCMVGGLEKQAQFTAAQWQALRELVTALRPLCMPGVAVVGHRELSPDTNGDGKVTSNEWLKTCPGFDVRAWLAADMQPTKEQVCLAKK